MIEARQTPKTYEVLTGQQAARKARIHLPGWMLPSRLERTLETRPACGPGAAPRSSSGDGVPNPGSVPSLSDDLDLASSVHVLG